MKITKPFLIATAFALVVAFSATAVAHPHGPGYSSGYSSGYGHGYYGPQQRHHHPRMHYRDQRKEHRKERQDLSSEQRDALRELRKQHHPAMRDLSREIRDNGVRLRRLMEDQGYNDEFERLAHKQGELIGRMIAQRAEMQSQVREIFNQ